MNKERLIWLDILKGFLILLVILGHSIQYILPEGECEHNYWWNLIYSFHMPVFMAASGFVNYRPESKPAFMGGISLIKRRTYQLLIPFFVWSIIKWCVSSNHTLSALIQVTFSNGGFFWFLWALWVITLISIGCNWIAQKMKIDMLLVYSAVALILIGVMVMLDIRAFGFQYIAFYFIFYSIGLFLNKYNQILTRNPFCLSALFLTWLLMGSFWNMHEIPPLLKGLHIMPENILQYCYRFVTAITAVYLMFSLLPIIFDNKGRTSKIMTYFGQNSLALYGLQGVVIFYVCDLTIKSSIMQFQFSQVIVSFCITLLICWCFLFLGNKQKHIKRIAFGKL